MPKIEIRKGEDLERALRKFKTKLRHEGIMDEMKKREFYESPSVKRKQKMWAASKKRKKVKRRP